MKRTTVEELLVRARAEGVKETEQAARRLGDAVDNAAGSNDNMSKTSVNLERSLDRMRRRIDPLYRAQQDFDRQQKILNRSMEAGMLSTNDYARSVELLQQRLSASNNNTARSTVGLTGAQDGLQNSLYRTANAVAILDGPLGGVASRFSAMGSLISGTGVLLGGVALAFAGAGFAAQRSVAAFQEFETQQLLLEGVLRATGGAAGQTAADIEGLAQSIAASTLASTTGVRQAAGQLLTFRSIAGETFERTLTLAQDLSAVGFGSISSASVQLGKALEDPVKGVSSLAEVGVSFSASQREVIKAMAETGRQAEAQRLILDAVEQQVGGAGSAAAGGLAGAYDSLGQAVENHLVIVGEQIAKYTLLREGILGIANAINEANEGLRQQTTAERLQTVEQAIPEQRRRLEQPEPEPRPGLFGFGREMDIGAQFRDQGRQEAEAALNALYEQRASLLRELQQEFMAAERANIAATNAAAQAAKDRVDDVKKSLQDQIEFNRLSKEKQAIQEAVSKAGVDAASKEGKAIADLVRTLMREDEARKAGVASAKKQNDEREKAQQAIQNVVEKLKFEIDQLGRTSKEQRLYNELKAAGVDISSAAGQEIARLVNQLDMEANALKRVADAAKGANAAMASGQKSVYGSWGEGGSQASISSGLNPMQAQSANTLYGEGGYDMRTTVGGKGMGVQGARMYINNQAIPNEQGFMNMDALRMYQEGAAPPDFSLLEDATRNLEKVVDTFASALSDQIRETERVYSRIAAMEPPRPDPYEEKNPLVFYDVNRERHFLTEQQQQLIALEDQLMQMRQADQHLREIRDISRENPALFAQELGRFLGNLTGGSPALQQAKGSVYDGLNSFNTQNSSYLGGMDQWNALAAKYGRDPNDPELQKLVSSMIEQQLKVSPFMQVQMQGMAGYQSFQQSLSKFGGGMAGFDDGGSFIANGPPGRDSIHVMKLAGREQVNVVTPAQKQRGETMSQKPQVVNQNTYYLSVTIPRDEINPAFDPESVADIVAMRVFRQLQEQN